MILASEYANFFLKYNPNPLYVVCITYMVSQASTAFSCF